jgi:hypothetical protein
VLRLRRLFFAVSVTAPPELFGVAWDGAHLSLGPCVVQVSIQTHPTVGSIAVRQRFGREYDLARYSNHRKAAFCRPLAPLIDQLRAELIGNSAPFLPENIHDATPQGWAVGLSVAYR